MSRPAKKSASTELAEPHESSDAFLGLPTDILGTQHIVLGYKNVDVTPDVFDTFPGTEFAIVGTVDSTTVTITPSVSTGARSAGVPYVINLDAGQTYLLQNTGGEPNDLSGTVILSDRPVAVLSGHSAANIPSPAVGYADYIVEQLLPSNQWGTEFITAPLATRGGGDTFRVIAPQDATEVSVNGQSVATIDQGEVYETLLTDPSLVHRDGTRAVGPVCQQCRIRRRGGRSVHDLAASHQPIPRRLHLYQ